MSDTDTEEDTSFQEPDGEEEIDDSMLSDDDQEDGVTDAGQLNIKDDMANEDEDEDEDED